MVNRKFVRGWEELKDCDFNMNLLQEQMIFCNFASDEDFENYFRVKEISDNEFFSLLDFFYRNDCHHMLFRLIKEHKERFVKPDIDEMSFREDFEERMKSLIDRT